MPLARGESSRSNVRSRPSGVSSSSSSTSRPNDLTFIFTINHLDPDWTRQEIDTVPHGQFWSPPTVGRAYISGPQSIYRWTGGRVTNTADPFVGVNRESFAFNSATVFSQEPYTPHLVAVNFDARAVDVSSRDEGWRPLTFFHEIVNGRVYSSVNVLGAQATIASPGSPRLVGQLLPQVYDYRHSLDRFGQQIPPPVTNAGLTGPLPILLALAAFSAPPGFLDSVLTTSVHPGTWYNHVHPSGRIQDRGMVVKVYLDPTNRSMSTGVNLMRLQDGQYGPFYGP